MKKWLGLCVASAVVVAGFNLSSPEVEAASSVLSSGSNCVAYKTKKTLALVKRVTVVGKSCKVKVKALKKGAKYGAEVSVPIKSFDSKEKDRDKEVLNILKAKVQPDLLFKTDLLTKGQWEKMLKNGRGAVKGKLMIAKKSYPLTAIVKVKKGGTELSGNLVTKFSKVGVKPPSVGPGGSIAKADDYLELHFNFTSKKLLNKKVIPGLK